MDWPEIPDHLVVEPSSAEALKERFRGACTDGCSNNGGYIQQATRFHEDFDDSGSPTNDYADLGEGKYDAIAITDTDFDGLASAALYRYQYGDDVKLLYGGYRESETGAEVLASIAEHAPDVDVPIYVADINPGDAAEWNEAIEAIGDHVYIRDHHPKTTEVDATEYVINHSKCATEIVLDADIDDPPAHITGLARAARVRDLWLPEHEDFERYALLDIYADVGIRSRVVETLAERGTGVLSDGDLYDKLCKLNYERWHRTLWLLKREELHDVRDFGGGTLRVISGQPVDTSHLAQHARETHGNDVVAIMLPDFGDGGRRVSLRSGGDHPIAGAIAERLGGGGHDDAASGKLHLNGDTDRVQVVEAGAALEQLARVHSG